MQDNMPSKANLPPSKRITTSGGRSDKMQFCVCRRKGHIYTLIAEDTENAQFSRPCRGSSSTIASDAGVPSLCSERCPLGPVFRATYMREKLASWFHDGGCYVDARGFLAVSGVPTKVCTCKAAEAERGPPGRNSKNLCTD